ncbi:MAG TPA: iron-containing alcohol dehydrogenase [Victivallales bacterium]|nr:iron-containing alcohol dehydrogenase [Victivallales bacterium]
MLNFSYYNPVNIVFGKDTISKLPELIPNNFRTLILYGGGSIKKNNVYDQVMLALNGYDIYEFSGIEPNPSYETCMEAVKLVKEKNINFLLSVGGGSVLDATKFIAAAAKFDDGDPWKMLSEAAEIKSVLPLGSVITLPATGSEMNSNAVLSRKLTAEKLALKNPMVFPQFSIIDPQTTYSLPKRQIINGIVDTYIHVTEQYITYDLKSLLQDRQAEAILLTLREIAQDVINKPDDYDTRANFFWCASQALNGLICCGVIFDGTTHKIGHELTAFYGMDHAQSIAVVLPRVWQNQKSSKKDKLLQYGRRVLGINENNECKAIDQIINETELFFNSLGMKTKLSDHKIDSREAAEKICNRFTERGSLLGEKQLVTPNDVKEILLHS